MSPTKKSRNPGNKNIRFTGWASSDADEIERRRLRGFNESIQVDSITKDGAFYGCFWAHSHSDQSYHVEIRSLTEHINSCNCPDHLINGLGTCKHIEAVLQWLQHRRKRIFHAEAIQGSPFIEIFLDRRDQRVHIQWPQSSKPHSSPRKLLPPFFTGDGILMGTELDTLPALERVINAASRHVRRRIRVSGEINPWLQKLDHAATQTRKRQHFETQVSAGKASLDMVRHSLYPYQQEGMLHLAFTGRALLADEMGLGKTIQAIAACELLRRTSGIRRVLVISPASLKGEWEDQIAKFSDLPSHIIQGPRAKRLRQYETPAFFSLANYEQIRLDATDINATLAPDVIILDEAQRIKNWQTKTARAVKRLRSSYAFVLTGTPLENRIDEIYSIVQFLDPEILGPLFRFNRDFYELDEKGHAIGYRNLNKLHARLQPIMLRRRKQDVEGQLPGRTNNTYMVPMHKEQSLRYEDYETKVARIATIARTRPLRKEEMERLQQFLACMRMLCDTPYILDQSCRISPKLEELKNILDELMAEGDHKVIIFSEWIRMLELVREQADEVGLGYAWHTGNVAQAKRRDEIRRFKDDPDCRLFLSSDSGSVGLNLQVADVVINLDMPWNPAKLEQRIARAWRKHQKRSVQVINLVSENTIEHRMLTLLSQKTALAAGVVDGQGTDSMPLPSGRTALLERIDALIGDKIDQPKEVTIDPMDRLRDNILAHWQHLLLRMELHTENSQRTLLVIAEPIHDKLHDALTLQLKQQFPSQTPQLQTLDKAAFDTIEKLIEAGILNIGCKTIQILYQASDEPVDNGSSLRLGKARDHLSGGAHKQRMASVLCDGGFSIEALVPMREAVEIALQALMLWQDDYTDQTPVDLALIDLTLVKSTLLPDDTLPMITALRKHQLVKDEPRATELLARSKQFFEQASSLLK